MRLPKTLLPFGYSGSLLHVFQHADGSHGGANCTLAKYNGLLSVSLHPIQNLAQKFEDLMRSVDQSAHLPGLVAENKSSVAALEIRVTALEAAENQRKGAVRLTEWAIRVIPFAALGAGFAAVAKVVGL